MTFDSLTLESPSFNAVNAGTMIRLPGAVWAREMQEVGGQEVAVGRDREPRKAQRGSFVTGLQIKGSISVKSATDTGIWNPTIVAGGSRTALTSAYEFLELMDDTLEDWWKEAVAGNWHDDGAPARVKGQMRARYAFKANGTTPKYIYGYVSKVVYAPPSGGAKDAALFNYELVVRRAFIRSVG